MCVITSLRSQLLYFRTQHVLTTFPDANSPSYELHTSYSCRPITNIYAFFYITRNNSPRLTLNSTSSYSPQTALFRNQRTSSHKPDPPLLSFPAPLLFLQVKSITRTRGGLVRTRQVWGNEKRYGLVPFLSLSNSGTCIILQYSNTTTSSRHLSPILREHTTISFSNS